MNKWKETLPLTQRLRKLSHPDAEEAIAEIQRCYSFIAACSKRRVHMGSAYDRYEANIAPDEPRTEVYARAKEQRRVLAGGTTDD